jgi:hypothetical protein
MSVRSRHPLAVCALLGGALTLSAVIPGIGATLAGAVPSTLPSKVFASATATQTKPDDITKLGEHIYVSFQNGVGPTGTPGSLGPDSTVAEFDLAGHRTGGFNIAGRVDGLTADPSHERLLATTNEDLNSNLWTIQPGEDGGKVTKFTYSPSPEEGQPPAGGTDSIAVKGEHIYITHSNPGLPNSAVVYDATLDNNSHVANLRAVFADNATAVDAVTGKPVTLALSDPDSNRIMAETAPRFAGQLAQVSQADSQIIFVKHPASESPTLTSLNLTSTSGTPVVDDVLVTTAGKGTLYVTDNSTGDITALSTDSLPAGTVFASSAVGSNNFLGTLDLKTGNVIPLGNSFTTPKGLLFVPAHEGDHQDSEG